MFEKGYTPWSKGLTKESSPALKEMGRKVSRILTGRTKETHEGLRISAEKRRGITSWSKGLTKDTHPTLMKRSQRMTGRTKDDTPHLMIVSIKMKDKVPWSKDKPSWNRGLTKETDSRIARQAEKSKGHPHKGYIPWNKGLTKADDSRIRIASEKVSKTIKGRTKETHPGVMAQSLKRKGRNKDNDSACLSASIKLTGRKTGRSWSKGMTKETNLSLLRSSEKMKGMFAGDKHPNWIDGRSYLVYGKDFKNLRKRIRERDEYTCQYCGVKEVNHYRKLDVHHIDYNRFNCNELNLITLCHLCNIHANKEREYWEYLFKGKMWMKGNRSEIIICG